MKTTLLFILFLFVNSIEVDLTGHWIWCKDIYSDGMTLNRNHCPEIKFYSNGKGSIDEDSNFSWKMIDKKIQLTFESEKQAKEYSFTKNTTLNIKSYKNENRITLIVNDSIKKTDLIWQKVE